MTRFAIISALLLCQAACGSSDTEKMCKAIVSKEAKCDADFDKKDKDTFVAACVALVSNDSEVKAEVEAESECAKKDSCSDYKACKRATRDKKELRKIAKQKDLSKRADACESLSAKVLSDEAKKVCEPGMKHWETEIHNAVLTAKKLEFTVCFNAERLAKKFGPTRAASVKTLCAQAAVAREVKKAVEKSAAQTAKASPSIPYECSWASTKLDKLANSAWKTKTYAKLTKACYVDVGMAIANKTKPSRYVCSYGVSEVIKAAKKHKLLAGNPRLLAALSRHKRCRTELASR